MIFPKIFKFFSFQDRPITWALCYLNFFFYIIQWQPVDMQGLTKLSEPEMQVVAVSLYKDFRLKKDGVEIADSELSPTVIYRDQSFLEWSAALSPEKMRLGNPVLIKEWQVKSVEFMESLKLRNTFRFGLMDNDFSISRLVTYQFTHAGLLHLLANVFYLFIFGCLVEFQIGSLLTGILYILGGILGGLSYSALSVGMSAPLVGASASLSALMMFYLLNEKEKDIPFFYFIAPLHGYFGEVRIFKWLILLLFVLPDLLSHVLESSLRDSVAYSAHIGGFIMGTLFYLTQMVAQHFARPNVESTVDVKTDDNRTE